MLSVKKLSAAKINRYLNYLIDYYASRSVEERADVEWVGGGAARLNLNGQSIDVQALRNLLKGFDPTGKHGLVRNAGRNDRMPGFDLTFSAPKSFSYIWSIASPELRQKLEQAFNRAVERTLSKIEADARVRTRNGNGFDRHEAQIVGVRINHHTARPKDENTRPDAALHAHTLLINTGFLKDGRSGSLDGLRILNRKGKVGRANQFALKYGQEFRDDLARESRALGFDLRQTKIRGGGTGWEIAGIPKSELSRNSKRSKQIREVAPDETHTPGQRRAATLSTRHSKTEIEPSQLFAVWQSEAAARGITADVIEGLRTQRAREIERELARERMRERGFGLGR